jgi:hypothetical protein
LSAYNVKLEFTSSPYRVKLKTMKLVFIASPLSTQH